MATGASKGTRKLAKGAIPAEVLQSVLQGIGDIPDPVTRDAVMAALLGIAGKTLSNMRTTRALATRSKPVRPFYDREAGVARDPEVATGGGRKAKGPDKPAGPVLREILNRRYDAAGPTGELFPNMTTGKISAAFKKHVFTKIPQNVLDKLLVNRRQAILIFAVSLLLLLLTNLVVLTLQVKSSVTKALVKVYLTKL
jgi:hypothetical protein